MQRVRARLEDEVLKLFTQLVAGHGNEQRRRQQLDQPADQAAPSSQPPATWPGGIYRRRSLRSVRTGGATS